MPADSPSDRIEDLLAECLEGPEDEWDAAIDAGCRAHPELADALRRRYGLIRPPAAPRSIPERLGPFRLIEKLGSGGMGVVYRALDEELGRQIALKVVRPEQLFFDGARRRFEREVEATARLQHPGIVPVYSVGEADGVPYYAMELIRGVPLEAIVTGLQHRDPATLGPGDLRDVFAAHPDLHDDLPDDAAIARTFGRSWVEIAFRLVRQAALATDHAHRHGILHRDLKPSNMMVTPDGRVQLVDFGLALPADTSRMTRTGSTIGSVPYMAPEQIRGSDVDLRCDVYALAVSLYELLTLRLPFVGADSEQTRAKVLAAAPRRPRELYRHLPTDAEVVCLTGMDVDPDRRYATAGDLARDLGNVLELRPIEARPTGVWLRTRRWFQRNRTLGATLVVGLLGALLVPLALYLQQLGYSAELAERIAAYERLSDDLSLVELDQEDAALWPAVPGNADAMRAWIGRGEELLSRLDLHRETLAALRAAALPYAAEDRAADDARRAALAAEIAQVEDALFQARGIAEPNVHETEPLEARLAELRAGLADRYTWRFAQRVEPWYHGRLTELVAGIEALPPRIAAMRERLALATTLADRTIGSRRADWDAARAAVRDDRRYEGLELTPQLGLVPLGPDPATGLLEFAHVASGAVPARDPATGRLAITIDTGVVLVLLPGGVFRMGARRPAANESDDTPNVDPLAEEHDEAPPHDVLLAPFLMSKFELTQAQWRRISGHDDANFRPGFSPVGEDITELHPIESVSWEQCDEMLRRLDLVLPTEAQWEYAARGGTTSPFWFGRDPAVLGASENLSDRALQRAAGQAGTALSDDGFACHAPVDALRANPFGLHHVLGNVSEWCRDDYTGYAFTTPREGDGLRRATSIQGVVIRGGRWNVGAGEARVSNRDYAAPTWRSEGCGVRPARALR